MAMAASAAKKKICVTGAGGFLASWVVKFLLSKGYIVHGTVRQPGDEKYAHLMKLEGASENLKLFKADLLSYESVHSAIAGCNAVFHVACPVPSTTSTNPEVEMIEPAVKGTTNVLEASLEAKVERVVYVSSVAAAFMNPNFPNDKVIDESCWSDKDYCRKTNNWYCFSKTEAEEQALDFAKRTGLDVVSICPTLVLGPILRSSIVNASSLVLLKILKGCESLENKHRWIVDVRDVAAAILLAYEKPEAEGRYICTSHPVKAKDMVEKLKTKYPNYNYPTNFVEVDDHQTKLSSEKLQRLGWRYKPLEETLTDAVESYKEAGLLQSK
ncbi:cinnamoyl-CoA reductase 1-like [Arachis stenosperma]|uniref:cinnamoyl-CoA reductase 1-like n=1 Tax=Arachis stenosperma TaxID=217475 RepID=UPI0025AD9218|nr:cinnamoyl-CoA reductase 1-like [Arachis stenosperma]